MSAKVAGLSDEDFQRLAEDAKVNCPVSQALAGIPITIEASLAQRVLVAGASGYIGTELSRQLEADGHTVLRLVRREPRAAHEYRWSPADRVIDPAAVEEAMPL